MVRAGLGVAVLAIVLNMGGPARADEPQVAKKPKEAADPKALAIQARGILRLHCHRCHDGPGSKGTKQADFLDRSALVKAELVKPGEPDESYLLDRIIDGEMPPERETPRPTADDTAALKRWIAAGAPEFPADTATRPFVTLKTVLTAVRDHLRAAEDRDRPYLRYFTFHYLANDPKATDNDLRLARAALSKAANSLSDQTAIVVPASIDAARLVFAIDIRDFGWDRDDLWQNVEIAYPYGLRYDHAPDEELRKLDIEVHELSRALIPVVRGDWFVATATRPPLYHELLRIPENAAELERALGLDLAKDFANPRPGRYAAAAFAHSGVTNQNRMLERHESRLGGYWKSRDFKPRNPRSDLRRFPLGPLNLFPAGKHPFADQAFVHDGGEIIYPLANGLQAYMLVKGDDARIDAGPIDVVSDPTLRTSGTVEIVNGVSCMACHKDGMIEFTDTVRASNAVFDRIENAVHDRYPDKPAMSALVARDTQRFLAALDRAVGPILREGGDAATPIAKLPEPIGPVARAYRFLYLDLKDVARELDIADPTALERQAGATVLKQLGLDGLARGDVVSRDQWEAVDGLSLMQTLAQALRYTPVFRR